MQEEIALSDSVLTNSLGSTTHSETETGTGTPNARTREYVIVITESVNASKGMKARDVDANLVRATALGMELAST